MERRSDVLSADQPPTRDDCRINYFDTVPDEVLRILLRHLSSRPQRQSWHPYISEVSVKTALDVGGALARAASHEFHGIGIKDGIHWDTADNVSMLLLCPIIHRLALHRLVLRLDGGLILPDVLRGCGAELKELGLDGRGTVVKETDILAVSTYCTNLSSFAIQNSTSESPLGPIWRSLGSNLTRIFICPRILDAFSVSQLMNHCVNLHHVVLGPLNGEIVDILLAIGSRIRVLGIGHNFISNVEQWRELYQTCTNL